MNTELIGKPIRILSLWQPWASAMFAMRPNTAIPVKAVETRHWELKGSFPFWLGIHAAKKPYRRDDYPRSFTSLVSEFKLDHAFMPYGALLGFVWATACRKVDDILRDGIDPIEQAFGNYVNEGDDLQFQQRYGFVTDPSKIKILKVPYAMRGQQGVWTWTPPEGLEFKEVCGDVPRETSGT